MLINFLTEHLTVQYTEGHSFGHGIPCQNNSGFDFFKSDLSVDSANYPFRVFLNFSYDEDAVLNGIYPMCYQSRLHLFTHPLYFLSLLGLIEISEYLSVSDDGFFQFEENQFSAVELDRDDSIPAYTLLGNEIAFGTSGTWANNPVLIWALLGDFESSLVPYVNMDNNMNDSKVLDQFLKDYRF